MKIPCLVSGFIALLGLPLYALEAKIEFADPIYQDGDGGWFDEYEYEYTPDSGWSWPDFVGGDDWSHPLEFRVVSHQLAPGTLVDVVITYEVRLACWQLEYSYNFQKFDSQGISTSFLGRNLDGPGTFSVPIHVTAPVGEWMDVLGELTTMGIQTDGLLPVDPSRPAAVTFRADGVFHVTSVRIPMVPEAGSTLGLLLLSTGSLIAVRRTGAKPGRVHGVD